MELPPIDIKTSDRARDIDEKKPSVEYVEGVVDVEDLIYVADAQAERR